MAGFIRKLSKLYWWEAVLPTTIVSVTVKTFCYTGPAKIVNMIRPSRIPDEDVTQ